VSLYLGDVGGIHEQAGRRCATGFMEKPLIWAAFVPVAVEPRNPTREVIKEKTVSG